ncbi:MAG TPA: helix-turn-helix transcriptional regulator, partial [Tepidiformaceae bacterium]|nr:helix-turn-helix transcriptional regulator [Tepidiformaceae bacterium]
MTRPTGTRPQSLDREPEWTPRQREVLALLAHGHTNVQIAEQLGITMDGAKWHVSEIITKLGVDTREEAAEYWRVHNGLRRRFGRVFRAMLPASAWAKAGAAAAVAVVVTGVAVVAVVVTNSGGTNARYPGASSPVSSPTAATSATANQPRTVSGVFTDPRVTTPTRTIQPPPPGPSPFKPWDGNSTVIYDTQAKTEMDLGPGSLAVFSPDSKHAFWAAGDFSQSGVDGSIRLLDLTTGAITTIGTGRPVQFLDNNTVAWFLGSSAIAVKVNIHTLAQTRLTEAESTKLMQDLSAARQTAPRTTPDGYRVEPMDESATAPPTKWQVVNLKSGAVVLQGIEASFAVAAGAGHIAIETLPSGGTNNVFLISIATGQATFLGTARVSFNVSFAADEQRVIWSSATCLDP